MVDRGVFKAAKVWFADMDVSEELPVRCNYGERVISGAGGTGCIEMQPERRMIHGPYNFSNFLPGTAERPAVNIWRNF